MPQSKTIVWITTQFESLHHWPDAPDIVGFLRHPHRHVFHVKLAMLVTHDDRDVEFILLKKQVSLYLESQYGGNAGQSSCEMIAKRLMTQFGAEWVEVSEDGENGARVERWVE